VNIKKRILDYLITESVREIQSARSTLEIKYAIECEEGYEVQVVITRLHDDFIGEVEKDYTSASVI
jgi:translation elongation factor EF-4